MSIDALEPAVADTGDRSPGSARSDRALADLMYDGFCLLMLLRQGQAPGDAAGFVTRIRAFIDAFEREARAQGALAEDIDDARYAFCATIDETILRSQLPLRALWERRPLQLAYFGDQVAGEQFFVRLEAQRAQGARRVQALEVSYLCLLLGFEGRYALEGSEKLGYLTARVGDELAQHRGRRAGFAPHWQAPDAIRHRLRSELPPWAIVAAFGLVALLAYGGLAARLGAQTQARLAPFEHLVTQPPVAANVTITLP